MVRCEILVAARYSDYEGSGTNRKARFHRVSELVLFPDEYAKKLEDSDMVEILTTDPQEEDAVIEIDAEDNGETLPSVPSPSQAALEWAAANGIDLNSRKVVGTGSDGRIVLADVRRYNVARSADLGEEGIE